MCLHMYIYSVFIIKRTVAITKISQNNNEGICSGQLETVFYLDRHLRAYFVHRNVQFVGA